MDIELKNELIKIAKSRIYNIDVSHDINHALRVLSNAEIIAKEENADLDIIIPAALFHDLVVHPKDHPDSDESQYESSIEAEKILKSLDDYPQEKIDKVKKCIFECSFNKGIKQKLLESQILQDSDGLEATGVISIMRTFASTGQMKKPFYNPDDTFCENRKPNALNFALDLFFERLLKVEERMYTNTAKKIAKRRTKFLYDFLEEFKLELDEK